MANIASQVKRIQTNEKARSRNTGIKSELRSAAKKVKTAVDAGKLEEAQAALKAALVLIDESVSKGIQHKNTAGRQKAHLQSIVSKLQK